MRFAAGPIALSDEEKAELEQMTQSRMLPAGDVMRARMVLLLAKLDTFWINYDLLCGTRDG